MVVIAEASPWGPRRPGCDPANKGTSNTTRKVRIVTVIDISEALGFLVRNFDVLSDRIYCPLRRQRGGHDPFDEEARVRSRTA